MKTKIFNSAARNRGRILHAINHRCAKTALFQKMENVSKRKESKTAHKANLKINDPMKTGIPNQLLPLLFQHDQVVAPKSGKCSYTESNTKQTSCEMNENKPARGQVRTVPGRRMDQKGELVLKMTQGLSHKHMQNKHCVTLKQDQYWR